MFGSLNMGSLSLSSPSRGGPSYEPEASALFARFTTPPDDARKALINTLIKALKASGDWAKLDGFYITAASDSQAARQNWIADQYNLTAVSSPVFTADRGYAGDGASSYLTTGFTPSTAGGKFALNSAHMGVWSRTDVANDGLFDIGSSGGALTALNCRRADNNFRLGLNEAALATLGGAGATSSVGHSGVERTSAAAKRAMKSGVQIGSDAVASTALPTSAITLLRGGTSGGLSTRQLASAHFGQSGVNWSAINAALTTYLQAIGAA